jgi:VWFA-related protein
MARPMLRLVSVFVFCALCAHLQLSAQSGAPENTTAGDEKPTAATVETQKFTSKSRLVLVPVVVADRSGEHITGLGRNVFKIEEHGKSREATIFEEVKTVAPDAKTQRAVATEGRSNFGFNDAKNWRMTIVVLDMLDTPSLYQAEGKRRLIQYLSRSLQREEPTALFGLKGNGLKQLHPFTTDTAVLLAALRKLQGQVGQDEINEQSATALKDMNDLMFQSASDETAQQISNFVTDQQATMDAFHQRESIGTTLTAMTQLAHAYSAIPGRKTLIWASGGFPFMIDDPQSFARMGTDIVDKYEEAWSALVSADIALYTVDMTGLGGGGSSTASGNFDARRSTAGMRPNGNPNSSMRIPYDKGAEKQATLRALADATGGVPCVNTNELEKCFSRAIDDSRQYYLLGYYLPSDDQKPGWRKLKVKVTVAGAHVRAREGFYVPRMQKRTPEALQQQMVDALRSPVEFTGVRLNVREVPSGVDMKLAVAGKSIHGFAVDVAADSVMVDSQNGNAIDLSLVAVAFGTDGKHAANSELHVAAKLPPERLDLLHKSGLRMKPSLELAPGKYEIRFAVRDNLTGEIGSVEYPLDLK